MAVMKRIATGALAVLLIFSFICCVYGYGNSERRFSVEVWIDNATKVATLTSMGKDMIVAIWTGNIYDEYDGEWTVLQILDGFRLFFVRVWDTGKVAVMTLGTALKYSKFLLPWNAYEGATFDDNGNEETEEETTFPPLEDITGAIPDLGTPDPGDPNPDGSIQI